MLFCAEPVEPPERPNIVLIMADDMGACDLGHFGNKDARTPNIDKLAAESMHAEAFYVASVCAPTRASVLTGRHHLRTAVSGVHGGKDFLHLEERTVADVLREAGYATGLWGKWHSGWAEGYLPHQRGFDEALMLRLYRHRDPLGSINGGDWVEFKGSWGDRVIVDHALDFARRNAQQPFFAMVTSMTPHGPLDAPEEAIAEFESRGLSKNLATLHAQVQLLDQEIGRLLEGLEEIDFNGRETVILFMSDNGPAMFENNFSDAERAQRNVLGWRGWKGDIWEGGVRSPLLVHCPGHFKAGTFDQVVDAMDLLPTFAAWAGVQPEQLGSDERPLDGRNITPLLQGKTLNPKATHLWVHPAIPPTSGGDLPRLLRDEYQPLSREQVAQMKPIDQVMGVRYGEWKLSLNADTNQRFLQSPQVHLSHIGNDPRESVNLAEEEIKQTEAMLSRAEAWWGQIQQEPHAFAPPDIVFPATGTVFMRATLAKSLSLGLRNGVIAIGGFCSSGQQVSWSVAAKGTLHVMPTLSWLGDSNPPEGTRFRLSCSGASIEGTAGADGAVTWDDALTIDAGPGTLTLEVIKMPTPPSPLELFGIRFEEVM